MWCEVKFAKKHSCEIASKEKSYCLPFKAFGVRELLKAIGVLELRIMARVVGFVHANCLPSPNYNHSPNLN